MHLRNGRQSRVQGAGVMVNYLRVRVIETSNMLEIGRIGYGLEHRVRAKGLGAVLRG